MPVEGWASGSVTPPVREKSVGGVDSISMKELEAEPSLRPFRP